MLFRSREHFCAFCHWDLWRCETSLSHGCCHLCSRRNGKEDVPSHWRATSRTGDVLDRGIQCSPPLDNDRSRELHSLLHCLLLHRVGLNPWVIAGEVAPNHVRPATVSLALGVNRLMAFAISRVTPNMLEEIKYGTLLLFGACCILMSAWVYFCLPETKGYALEDIRVLFEKDMNPVVASSWVDGDQVVAEPTMYSHTDE